MQQHQLNWVEWAKENESMCRTTSKISIEPNEEVDDKSVSFCFRLFQLPRSVVMRVASSECAMCVYAPQLVGVNFRNSI